MKFTISSLSVLAFTAPNLVQAWSGIGHVLIARIANTLLEKESPSTIENVNSILSVLKKSDPGWTKKEQDHPFVECTTFADDIKYHGGSY